MSRCIPAPSGTSGRSACGDALRSGGDRLAEARSAGPGAGVRGPSGGSPAAASPRAGHRPAAWARGRAGSRASPVGETGRPAGPDMPASPPPPAGRGGDGAVAWGRASLRSPPFAFVFPAVAIPTQPSGRQGRPDGPSRDRRSSPGGASPSSAAFAAPASRPERLSPGGIVSEPGGVTAGPRPRRWRRAPSSRGGGGPSRRPGAGGCRPATDVRSCRPDPARRRPDRPESRGGRTPVAPDHAAETSGRLSSLPPSSRTRGGRRVPTAPLARAARSLREGASAPSPPRSRDRAARARRPCRTRTRIWLTLRNLPGGMGTAITASASGQSRRAPGRRGTRA